MYYRDIETKEVFRSDSSASKGVEKITKKEYEESVKENARKKLLEILSPGQTVYTILRHQSSSGMSRRISLAIGQADGSLISLDWLAARAMNDCVHKDGGIVVKGCGMDMGFHLVYGLGAALWPNGTLEPHGRRNGELDSSGGYALRHQWF